MQNRTIKDQLKDVLTQRELAKLKQQVAALKGCEFKMDYTYSIRGHVTDCYIAQADLFRGITTRGAKPFNNPEQDGDDMDLWCINAGEIGYAFDMYPCYTIHDYIDNTKDVIKAVQEGVYVVQKLNDATGGTSCAF